MATYFGEVLSMESRAVEDDEPDDTVELQLDFKPPDIANLSCKILVFCVGSNAACFGSCYLKSADLQKAFDVSYSVGRSQDDPPLMYTGGLKNASRRAATVYSAAPSFVMVTISDNLPEEIHVDLCESLLSKISATETIVLTTQHVSTFKSADFDIETPFLRALPSARRDRPRSIEPLLAPNFVPNFAGAVLTEAEVKGNSCLCVVSYVESMALGIFNVRSFEKVFDEDSSLQLSPGAQDAAYKQVQRAQLQQSNLYS